MAIETQGCVLYWSTTTSLSTVISIGEVVGFNGPTGSANVIDASHLGSTAKEKMIGLRDEGQITLDCNLAPADSGQVKLRECRAARTQGNWAIKMTDGHHNAERARVRFRLLGHGGGGSDCQGIHHHRDQRGRHLLHCRVRG